jgi:hypothetical protein
MQSRTLPLLSSSSPLVGPVRVAFSLFAVPGGTRARAPSEPSRTFDRSRFAMMKPTQSILDHSFRYVPAVATSVMQTWRRFGWQPTTDDERQRRRSGLPRMAPDERLPAAWPARRTVSTVAVNT